MKEKKMGFTQGPWSVWMSGEVVEVHAAEGEHPATVIPWPGFDESDRPLAEHKANARLIAAAPDLLSALEGILCDWHDGTIPLVYRGKPGAFDAACQRIAKARSAIAKARGSMGE